MGLHQTKVTNLRYVFKPIISDIVIVKVLIGKLSNQITSICVIIKETGDNRMKEIIRVYVAFESGLVGVTFYLHQRHEAAKSCPLQEIELEFEDD